MAITPTHGRLGAIYVCRPNGFDGSGLNDLAWGSGATNAATAYYKVTISTAAGTDKFTWSKNGGAESAEIEITGEAQTLDEGQTITFTALTGHTLADCWYIGNLVNEPCTLSGQTATITETTRTILNPNHPPTFTDAGAGDNYSIDYTRGVAYFTSNPVSVTCSGNNGFIPTGAMIKVGYVLDWSLQLTVDTADVSCMGSYWKESLIGLAGGNGSVNAYFIASKTMFDTLKTAINSNDKFYFLKLFTYDPDKDQTGDHFRVWAIPNGFNLTPAIGDVVKEGFTFQIQGMASFNTQVFGVVSSSSSPSLSPSASISPSASPSHSPSSSPSRSPSNSSSISPSRSPSASSSASPSASPSGG